MAQDTVRQVGYDAGLSHPVLVLCMLCLTRLSTCAEAWHMTVDQWVTRADPSTCLHSEAANGALLDVKWQVEGVKCLDFDSDIVQHDVCPAICNHARALIVCLFLLLMYACCIATHRD